MARKKSGSKPAVQAIRDWSRSGLLPDMRRELLRLTNAVGSDWQAEAALEIEEARREIERIAADPDHDPEEIRAAYKALLDFIENPSGEEEEIMTEVTPEMDVAEAVKILRGAGAKLSYRQKRKLDDIELGGTLPDWAVDVINNHIRQNDTPDGGKAGELIGSTRGLFWTLRLREVVNFDELRELPFLGWLWWLLRSVWSVIGLIPYGKIIAIVLMVLFVFLPRIGGPILGLIFRGGIGLIWAFLSTYILYALAALIAAIIGLVLIRPWLAVRQAIRRLAHSPGWSMDRIKNDPEAAVTVLIDMVWTGEYPVRAALGVERGGQYMISTAKDGAGRAWDALKPQNREFDRLVKTYRPFMDRDELKPFRFKLMEVANAQGISDMAALQTGYGLLRKSYERIEHLYQDRFLAVPEDQELKLEALFQDVVKDLLVLKRALSWQAPANVDLRFEVEGWLETVPPVV